LRLKIYCALYKLGVYTVSESQIYVSASLKMCNIAHSLGIVQVMNFAAQCTQCGLYKRKDHIQYANPSLYELRGLY